MSDMLKYELSSISSSIVDEYGSLRKGYKSVLVKSFGVVTIDPPEPNVVLVDAG